MAMGAPVQPETAARACVCAACCKECCWFHTHACLTHCMHRCTGLLGHANALCSGTQDKKKVDAGEPAFQARDIKCLAYKTGIKHIAKRLHSMRDMLAANPDSEFLIVNRMLPTTPWMNVISLFERPKAKKGEDPVFESLLESYKAASSEEKDLKLKYIVKIPNASWVVR